MKFPKLLIATAAFVALPAFAADEADHHQQSVHGGVVVEVRHIDLELVARPERVQLYLRDHGKPLDVSGGSAKLTLLSGGEKQEAELLPVDGRLEAQGSFKVGPGTKAVAVVSRPGKASTTARFTLK